MKKKVSLAVIILVLVICFVSIMIMFGNKGDISNVNRVVGYSALYGEELINEAFDVI